LKALKKYNLKFCDNSFTTNESLIYINSNNNELNIPLLNNDNYNIYEKMKKYSLNDIYPNLKLLELNNETCIQVNIKINFYSK